MRKDLIRALTGFGLVKRLSQFLIDPGHQHVPRYSVETVEAMQKPLLGYRDDLRVEVESGYEANAS